MSIPTNLQSLLQAGHATPAEGAGASVAIFGPDAALLYRSPKFAAEIAHLPEADRSSEALALAFAIAPAEGSDLREANFEVCLGDTLRLSVSKIRLEGVGWVCVTRNLTEWIDRETATRMAARTDADTGLPNRAYFSETLDGALREDGAQQGPGAGVALVTIAIDRLKFINDTLGHAVATTLLRKIVDRIRRTIRPEDVLARLEGCDFVILQRAAPQPAAAQSLAKRLIDILGRPFVIEGHMVSVSARVGIAMAPEHAQTAPDLITRAATALEHAEAADGGFMLFDPSMDERMRARRQMELDLRRALAFRQLELHYQPQMDLARRRITGFEALLRWNHPEKGMVPPGDFIPVAEATGLIVPIGEWVIRQACRDAAGWPDDICVAVNVSGHQLFSPALESTLRAALAANGIAPARFEVEVTESVLIDQASEGIAMLHRIHDLGVRISMDDFGTGYSSLSHLRSFPFDKIKIDQGFVRRGESEDNAAIVRAITAIGSQFNMTTIAEGVETEAQLAEVLRNGCQSIQGYYLSKPVPAARVFEILESDRARDRPIAAADPVVEVADLHRLVYYSRNAMPGSPAEIEAGFAVILAASQRNNAAVNVTGALMFTDGYFAQVLEGPQGAVEETFERIQLDVRHSDVQLLEFEPAEARMFTEWSMAFVGASEAGRAAYGHIAARSGFDLTKADGAGILSLLRTLLVEEEMGHPGAE